MITETVLLRFEAFLQSEPIAPSSMSVPMVDGMLTAAVIGPRPVGPGELLPWVLDRRNGQSNPGVHVLDAQEILNGMILLQNRIAGGLSRRPPEFVPLFLIHAGWSHVEWVEGFEVGMNFAPDTWSAAIDVRKHFFGPIASFSDTNVRELVGEDWPELIASLERGVIGFRDYFRGETRAEFFAAHTPVVRKGPKVGRNEPCPCGSGRKHKKCCGGPAEVDVH